MEQYDHPLDSKGRCILGAHTSAAGGSWNALNEGQQIDASGVQLFTSSQRKWEGKILTKSDGDKFKAAANTTGVKVNMSHGSYLVNLGTTSPDNLIKSKQTFQQELARCQTLGVDFLAFHPGSANDDNADACLNRIVESLLEMKEFINIGPTKVLIESTAGQGSTVGVTFAQLHKLIEGVKPHLDLGICLDTCHMFAAGYDIRDEASFDATMKQFDAIVGLRHLRAFHVNDSLSPLGSNVDRHAMLGEGHIGWLAFKLLMTDKRTKDVPKYLETPGDVSIWKKEIAILRSLALGDDIPKNNPSPKMRPEKSSNDKKRKSKSTAGAKSKSKTESVSDEEANGEGDEDLQPKPKRRKTSNL